MFLKFLYDTQIRAFPAAMAENAFPNHLYVKFTLSHEITEGKVLPPPFTLMLWNFLYIFDVESDIRMMLRGNTASPRNLNRGVFR